MGKSRLWSKIHDTEHSITQLHTDHFVIVPGFRIASGPVLCDFLHFLEDVTELFVVPSRQIVVVQRNAEVPTTWSCEAIRCQRNWFAANYSQALPCFLLDLVGFKRELSLTTTEPIAWSPSCQIPEVSKLKHSRLWFHMIIVYYSWL